MDEQWNVKAKFFKRNNNGAVFVLDSDTGLKQFLYSRLALRCKANFRDLTLTGTKLDSPVYRPFDVFTKFVDVSCLFLSCLGIKS